MSLTIIKEKEIGKIYTMPGDTISLSYNDEKILTSTIDEDMIINKVIIFKAENELGLKKGIGGIFGEKLTDIL